MTFNSISYFIFLPAVFLVFHITADRYRWLALLISSYIFYGFLLKPSLLIVLAFVTIFSYYMGNRIDTAGNKENRKKLLFFSVAGNLAVLVYFKYLAFLVENLNILVGFLAPGAAIPEPAPLVSIALSFFIFQAISYLSDIYFGITKPEVHPGHFALYISFFPKLLQGPIERAESLLPQLRKPYEFHYTEIRSGLLLFVWGLFLKVVVADRLALFVDPVYNNVEAYTGIPLIIATYAYAFQIYFDFAGYTNMALGGAKLFGLNLTQNFRSPYLATSCADFWRRWHISFSRWILDYIFQPLQMKWRNLGKNGTALALFVTFLLSGLWHGASWTFIIWGLLHGVFLAASTYYKPYKKQLHKKLGIDNSRWLTIWQVIVTFHLVSFTYIFFRASSIEDAGHIIANILNIYSNYTEIKTIGISEFITKNILIGNRKIVAITLLLILSIILVVYKHRDESLFTKPVWFRWACYYSLFIIIVVLQISTKTDFIYLQF